MQATPKPKRLLDGLWGEGEEPDPEFVTKLLVLLRRVQNREIAISPLTGELEEVEKNQLLNQEAWQKSISKADKSD